MGHPALSPAQAREVTDWPAERQHALVTSLDAYEAQGYPLPAAESMAYHAVKVQLEAGGQAQAPKADLSDWPREGREEAKAMATRLRVGGWEPDQARLLATAIMGDRQGRTVH